MTFHPEREQGQAPRGAGLAVSRAQGTSRPLTCETETPGPPPPRPLALGSSSVRVGLPRPALLPGYLFAPQWMRRLRPEQVGGGGARKSPPVKGRAGARPGRGGSSCSHLPSCGLRAACRVGTALREEAAAVRPWAPGTGSGSVLQLLGRDAASPVASHPGVRGRYRVRGGEGGPGGSREGPGREQGRGGWWGAESPKVQVGHSAAT